MPSSSQQFGIYLRLPFTSFPCQMLMLACSPAAARFATLLSLSSKATLCVKIPRNISLHAG
jgi:hypothetical protein